MCKGTTGVRKAPERGLLTSGFRPGITPPNSKQQGSIRQRERGHGTHAHLAHSVRGPCCRLYRPSYGMINDRNPAAPLDPGDKGEDDVEMTQANAWLRPFQSVSDDKAPSNVTTITFSCAGIANHDTELARVLRALPCPACCHSNHCGYQTLRAFTYSILE